MAELDTNVNAEVETDTNVQTEVENVETEKNTESAELAKLRAELAKQKAAFDKASSEAASMKKQLRAKQTAEEAEAEAKKEAEEALQKELTELRKKFAVAETGKKLITFLQDETQANEAAGYLYGAEDVDSALAIIQKAWTAREKALRIEYGKIAAPGTGSGDGPTYTRAQLDAMKYVERVKFANEHPDEYNKIMGR